MRKRVISRLRVRDLRDRPGTRRVRVISIATAVLAVLALIIGVGWKNGYRAVEVRLLSGAAWLPSSHTGQLTLLDGSSAEVAAQIQVAPPGHRLNVIQRGTTAYAINHTEGSLRRIDGGTFDLTPPATHRGLRTHTDAQVSTQAAVLDDADRLWVLDTATGDLTWIKDGQPNTRRQASHPSQGMLVLAGGSPVLVDVPSRTAATLNPKTGNTEHTTQLEVRPDDPVQVGGSPLSPRLHVVTSRGVLRLCKLSSTSCENAVPLGETGADLGPPIEADERVFIPDYAHGQVWIVDLQEKRVVAQSTVLTPSTRFQLLSHDGIVFFNDPNSERAGVIRHDGSVIHISKHDPQPPSAENSHDSTSSTFPDRTSTGDGLPSGPTDSSAATLANPSLPPGQGGDSVSGEDPGFVGDPGSGEDPGPDEDPGPGGDPLDLELFDDFSGSAIDSEKWERGSGFDTVPPLIYAQDGLLNMRVTREHGSGENSAVLRANLPGPARAISFEMIVLVSEGLNDGGGLAVISSRDSHNHKVAFGPDGDGFPGVEYFICNKESGCDDGVYEDFEHPGRSQLQLQQRYNVLIQQSDTGWSFKVDGFPEATAQLENGPIRNFDFGLYSFGEGVYHVAVDNVKIDYAT